MARTLLPGEAMRVIVVDDHRAMADFVVALLRSHGQDARAAYHPDEAMIAAETSHPDAVISDLHMPGMNGFELAEVLSQRYPKCRIILMTATPEFADLSGRDCPFPVLQKAEVPDHLLEALAVAAPAA
jgi:CheY-like chemotaxis protein